MKLKDVEEFFNNSSEPVVVFDRQIQVHFKNVSALRLFFDKSGEFLLESKIRDWLQDPSKTLHFLHPHVDDCLIDLRVMPLQENNERLILYCCNLSQALELVSVKNTQEISDQKFALDQSALVSVTDVKGVITYANEKFCAISEYSSDELLGQSHRIVNSGLHGKSFFSEMWLKISEGQVWKGIIRNRSKSGRFYWVSTSIVPTLDQFGRPERFISIRFDVTDRVLAEEIIEADRLKLLYSEKMSSLGQLAAGIAHELGNPLASIDAWREVVSTSIRRGTIKDIDFLATLDEVKKKTEKMAKILRGMLSFARDGSLDPMNTVNLVRLIEDVLEYCSYKLKKSRVQAKFDRTRDFIPLYCRETEILQVLTNLILNSCDAVSELSERWVEIKIEDNSRSTIISVIDSGLGISDDIVERVMEPFFTTKAHGKGTGLGLSIAKSIVAGHSGTLQIDRLSPHTKFDIILPNKK
jgi:PAS domain S-box-containing protein